MCVKDGARNTTVGGKERLDTHSPVVYLSRISGKKKQQTKADKKPNDDEFQMYPIIIIFSSLNGTHTHTTTRKKG